MRHSLCTVLIAAAFASPVLAKLPPLNDDAKAKAAEAAAKTAWSDKVGAYQLCKAMDRVADGYRRTSKGAGTDAAAPVAMPPCADPGLFAAQMTPAASKPIEASGAHSPPGMAMSPPSNKATSAEMTGGPKK